MAESPKAKSKSEDEYGEEGTTGSARQMETDEAVVPAAGKSCVSRKEKRKAAKKEKRKQIRKELAEKARAEEEARLNDPEEQRRIQLEEQRENERIERERREFEEREKLFLQELELLSLARKKAQEEEEEEEQRRREQEESKQPIQDGAEEGPNEDDEWEYVEEGPPEIIWQGNEIIVKKKRVKVRKKDVGADKQVENEDPNRPTSNPLPPQSEAYAAYRNAPMPSAQQLLESVAQEIPNFGTEQDKAHCPFHIKTGACRFGMRCNRVHFYPDKSCTLLIKNMYNGPGLAWEQDEGLEYTDEEVERCYEEFYEDVHTEFLKFGEIVNFKVCRNGSFHLRGNVYVHYKSLDSAVEAYNSVNGRYFAGKQVTCEFVSLTKWKIAICGEYMKSRLKTCSRGTACNFLHCFSNPGGDYDWANSDKPPPRYWVKKMSFLFGYLDEAWNDKEIEHQSPRERQNSSRMSTSERDRYHSKRHRSVETDEPNGYGRSDYAEYSVRKSRSHERHTSDSRKQHKSRDEKYSKEETNYRSHSRDKQNKGYRRSDFKESGVRESQSRERHTIDSRKRQKSLDEKYYKEETTYRNHHPSNYGNEDGDSDRDCSDRDLDEERHQTRHGGTSKHSRQDMEARHYDRASRRTSHESGSDEDLLKPEHETDRHQGHKGKRSRHRKKSSVLSDDNLDSTDAKLEQQRIKKGHTGKSGYSNAETSEVEFAVHKDRTDSRSKYDEGHRVSESKRLPKKKRSSRKTPVDEDVDLYGSDKYERKRKSRDSEYYPGEENDEIDRWDPEQTTPEEYCHKSRRKLNVDDRKQGSVRSGSYDQKSDEQLSGASCEEHSENFGELDSAQELKHSIRSESSDKNYRDKWSSDHQNVKEKRPDKRIRI